MYNIFFSPYEVQNILKKVDPSKAAGPDGIDGYVLKRCCTSISIPLSILFSKSYNTGIIPQEWKNANVVPIHKKSDKSCVENYRPISLTSLIMKIFEKCIRNKLHDICLDKITAKQHGFLPSKSCTTQMIEFTADLAINLNSKLQTDIVYFDFAKAFDSVSHDIILHKLKYNYGIDGKLLNFLLNYLINRKQRVVVDGEFSEWAPVLSGVPQGSILGPTLFVLFINDIVNVVSDETKVLLYADDMKIWRKIDSIDDQRCLQNDIDSLYHWSVSNKIKFHPSKCKVIRSTLRLHPTLTNYSLNNVPLEVSENERDLGVIMHPKLLYNKHHQGILAKASQKLGLVKRNCSITLCPKSRKTLYLTLVRSLFEHCSQVWRPMKSTHILKFENTQKRAVKWILNENYHHYSKSEYSTKLKELDILPVDLKFELNDMVLFHKIFYGNSVVSFPSFIARQTDQTQAHHFQRQTRTFNDNDRLKLKAKIAPRVEAFKCSYFYRSLETWNSIPFDIRSIEDPAAFKSSMKAHLWTIAENWPT